MPAWVQHPLGAAGITLAVHGLMLLWLLAGDRQSLPASEPEALQVEWIRREAVSFPIPAMPEAPARTRVTRVRSEAVTRVPEPAADSRVDEAPGEPESAPLRPLSAQVGEFARAQNSASTFQRGPLDRPAQALPGRGEAFVEGFHVREEVSPSDRVQMVLSLVGLGGGGGASCADLRRKITSDISDEERRKLVDDERRICRRGQAGTYR